MNRVIPADGQSVTVTRSHPHFQIGPDGLDPRGNRRCAAVNRMEPERIHVIRETAGTADARNNHKILALDAEFREYGLHRGKNGVVAAAWTPTNFLVGLKIFFGQ